MRWRKAANVFLLHFCLCLGACGSRSGTGDFGQPIPITTQLSVPLATMRLEGTEKSLKLAIDTATSLTALSEEATRVDPALEGNVVDARLQFQDAEQPETTRFQFFNRNLLRLPLSPLGKANNHVTVDGMLGADVLASFSVRFDYRAPAITFSRGFDAHRGDLLDDCLAAEAAGNPSACVGGFRQRRIGGGFVAVGSYEDRIAPTRLTFPLCVLESNGNPTPSQTPVTALLATGLPHSILSQSAYDRLAARGHPLPDLGQASLSLPYGTEPAHLTQLPHFAIVSNETRDLGACEERLRRTALARGDIPPLFPTLENQDAKGATVIDLRGSFSIAVVRDDAPIFFGIREELRSISAEIDMILASDLLSHLLIEVAYPEQRTMFQCATTRAECVVLPVCYADQPSTCLRSEV